LTLAESSSNPEETMDWLRVLSLVSPQEASFLSIHMSISEHRKRQSFPTRIPRISPLRAIR